MPADQDQAASGQSIPLTTPQSAAQEVGGIATANRIPTFWRDKVRLWFIAFETATADLKKSQAQLAQLVVAQLDKHDVESISDLLLTPSPDQQYKRIKTRLITVYEESEQQQFQKLLEIELGGQRPSQLLRRMRNLALDRVPDSTLKLMWMNHLPPSVRSVLVVSDSINKETKLDDLALLADKMMEHHQEATVMSVASSSSRTTPQPPHADMQYLVEEIRKLSVEVGELKSSQRNHANHSPPRRSGYYREQRARSGDSPRRRRDHSPHPRRYYSRDRSASSHSRAFSPSPYCYYHRRFGKDAYRCTTPCTFRQERSPEN